MTMKVYTDRSRIITASRCMRRRLLEYHWEGTGIVPGRMPLPLAVGIAVHAGLERLLRDSQELERFGTKPEQIQEELAVKDALAEFNAFAGALDVDVLEAAALTAPQTATTAVASSANIFDDAAALGVEIAPGQHIGADPAAIRSRFDAWLFAEQSALVEAMVRAYSRRRLRPLLEEFEVLEVEREGQWQLSTWKDFDKLTDKLEIYELWFMSRPDALLRHRQTNDLYLLSYKTTGQWDVRKARDITHDMQGLSEGVEVEQRLASWWNICKGMDPIVELPHLKTTDEWDAAYAKNLGTTPAMIKFLRMAPAAPRIHAIRYEFLLKGERWKDKDLSTQLGVEARSQRSHLIRQHVAVSTPKKGDAAYQIGDVCWSWDFTRPEDQKDSSLAWQNWKGRPVWEQGSGAIKDWIDKLDRTELLMSGEDSTMGMEPRVLGYRSDAQAMGVTKEHPLDAAFVPPVTIWRNDDDLRDLVDEMEAGERRIAEGVAQVAAAKASGDAGETRHLLNVLFPKNRQSCEYPSTCSFVKVCYGGPDIQADPLRVAPNDFKQRTPNHPQEKGGGGQ